MNLRLLAFLKAIVLALVLAWPASASDAEMVAEVEATLETLKKAFVDRDGATIKQIMTEDGLLITPYYHAAMTPDEVAANLSTLLIESHASHQVNVRPLGPGRSLMTLYTSFEGTYDGRPLPRWVFSSAVWVRRDDGWRVELYQETVVDAP
ncbi:nuclear transport factor 2 family protein [Bauldia sp.]|uniref:nuclear transport factor 2 family protein n=1 Tax=Bauldia sp. TaxID=2575872 RepID=UPI003BAC17A7